MKTLAKTILIRILLSIIVIGTLDVTKVGANDLLIRNARIIDGKGNPPQDKSSILIKGGRIFEIGENISAKGIRELDVKGAYVLPGIIDSHVHIMWGPGGCLHNPKDITPENWKSTWGKYFSHYLKAYLACGVTTVLDMGAYPYVIRDIREHLAAGNPGPRYLTVGPFIASPEGYFDQMNTVDTIESVEETLDFIQTLNVVGIKVPIEKGWDPMFNFSRHSPEILDAIKKGADKRDLPVFIHATSLEDLTTAVSLKPYALAHTLISRRDETISDEFIVEMKRSGAYQMTTLSTMDAALTLYHPERLDDPLLKIVAPEIELATAMNSEKVQKARELEINYVSPYMPEMLLGIIVSIFNTREQQETSLENSQQAIFRLHKAGVPIIMGSDNIYAPTAIFDFHGFTTLREIELLGEAGLTPAEAIEASTVTPSKMLGLENEIGTIEIGKFADLVIVRDNPLTNLRAFRTVLWTVKEGIAHTPKEWMMK